MHRKCNKLRTRASTFIRAGENCWGKKQPPIKKSVRKETKEVTKDSWIKLVPLKERKKWLQTLKSENTKTSGKGPASRHLWILCLFPVAEINTRSLNVARNLAKSGNGVRWGWGEGGWAPRENASSSFAAFCDSRKTIKKMAQPSPPCLKPSLHNSGSQRGGGFYGYRLKFWLFFGYRLIFCSYG